MPPFSTTKTTYEVYPRGSANSPHRAPVSFRRQAPPLVFRFTRKTATKKATATGLSTTTGLSTNHLFGAQLNEGEVGPIGAHGDPHDGVARARGQLEVLHGCVHEVLKYKGAGDRARTRHSIKRDCHTGLSTTVTRRGHDTVSRGGDKGTQSVM